MGDAMVVQPEHMELVGNYFAVRWNDGSETVVGLEALRRACPCARCAGEPDLTGAIRMPAHRPAYVPASFQISTFERVGHYAVALTWGDGHNTGLYGWSLLRELGE